MKRLMVIIIALAALAVVACGSDDSDHYNITTIIAPSGVCYDVLTLYGDIKETFGEVECPEHLK